MAGTGPGAHAVKRLGGGVWGQGMPCPYTPPIDRVSGSPGHPLAQGIWKLFP